MAEELESLYVPLNKDNTLVASRLEYVIYTPSPMLL